MKVTGIVRRVDELGRIVIPKDIRRALQLKVGTSLEIFIEGSSLVLKEYSAVNNINGFALSICECLSKTLECDVILTDMNNVVSASGKNKKYYENKKITDVLYNKIIERKNVISTENNSADLAQLIKTDNLNNTYLSQIISPIIINGDCYGSIVAFSEKNFSLVDSNALGLMCCLITKQLEL